MNRESTPDTIERELKLGLRDCDPRSVSSVLLALLGRELTGTTRVLVNRYYDLSGQLHKAGVAIRTRSMNDQHEMTVKIREPDEGGLTQRSEWNFPIDEPAAGSCAAEKRRLARCCCRVDRRVARSMLCLKMHFSGPTGVSAWMVVM